MFIPRENTWISLKNTGTEPIGLTFVFSAPGFEDTMRCNSVPTGETPTERSRQSNKKNVHTWDIGKAGRQEPPQK